MRTGFALLCSEAPDPARLEELAALGEAELLVISDGPLLPIFAASLCLVRPLLPGRGPVALLHAALLAARAEALVAIDAAAPFPSLALLRGLATHRSRGNLLLIASTRAAPRSLPARFRRGCLRAVRAALRRDEQDLLALTASLPASLVSEEELCALGVMPGEG